MDLIGAITSQLGISPPAAEGAVGTVLSLIKQQAPPDAFAEVEAKAPETKQWMAAADGAPTGGSAGAGGVGGGIGGVATGGGGLGGMLGNLAGAAGGLLGGGGGGAGGLAGVIAGLSRHGIGGSAVSTLVPLVLQFLRSKVGDGVLGRLTSSVPFLKELAGGQPGAGSPLGGLGNLFK